MRPGHIENIKNLRSLALALLSSVRTSLARSMTETEPLELEEDAARSTMEIPAGWGAATAPVKKVAALAMAAVKTANFILASGFWNLAIKVPEDEESLLRAC